MIQASELRIGNYLRKSAMLSPFAISAGDIVGLSKGFYILHPVPLTPELLERCEFINLMCPSYPCYSLNQIMVEFISPNIIHVRKIASREIHVLLSENIKYLHQLQNLFWCLTGKELEIKELV